MIPRRLAVLCGAIVSAFVAARDAYEAYWIQSEIDAESAWMSQSPSADECFARATALGFRAESAARIANAWKLAHHLDTPLVNRRRHR